MSRRIFSSIGCLFKLLVLVTILGCAQADQVSLPTSPPSPIATLVTASSTPIAMIDRESIADPKVGDTCVYQVDQGLRREHVTQRVDQVSTGYSFRVAHDGIRTDSLSIRYLRDGNPWVDEVMRYRSLFRYPLTLASAQWEIWEHTGGRAGDRFLENNLTARLTEVGQVVLPGFPRPIRVVGLEVSGHYSMHDPGSNGTYGTGRITLEVRYAPDLHCYISQRLLKTKWDGSPYILEMIRLVDYRSGQ